MKYAKKIKKHFEYISNEGHLLKLDCTKKGVQSFCALLNAGLEHFFTGEKALDFICKVKKHQPTQEYMQKLIAEQDNSLLGELLFTFCTYQKTTGMLDCDQEIERIASSLLKTQIKDIENIFESNNNIQVLSPFLSGVTAYYLISSDLTAKGIIDFVINKIETVNLSTFNLSVFDYLNICVSLLQYAKKSNKTAVYELIARLFDDYMVNCQSINYEACVSFENKNETSPGATAKSLELSLALYEALADGRYLTVARRIWFNGLQFCQRFEGQVGSNTFTDATVRLRVKAYSSDLIESARYATALKYYALNKKLFEEGGELTKDRRGRYFLGDKMFGLDESDFFGRDLIEIPTLTAFDAQTAKQLIFRLTF